MSNHRQDFPFSRRELLRRSGTGLGFLGLAALLATRRRVGDQRARG